MTTIVTRSGKGSSLSWAEADANFTNLNTEKLEASALSSYETSSHAASTYATITSVNAVLPNQVAQSGKFLQTDGSVVSWQSVGGGGGGSGTVTTISITPANGLSGTVANPTTTPQISLSTTITGVLKGNGTAISAATAGTDYAAVGSITTSGITQTTGKMLGRTTASTGAIEEINIGSGLSLSAGTLSNTAGQLAGFRNVLINADFRINQRAYSSAAVLAAAVYGHDRWKAGASGGDYSFTQLKSSTQITIAAGKSLIQVIEDANITGGSYVLSWSGTAQARVGVNSATPSGSYTTSPILITGQTAGTVMSVEFNTGTLNMVQLEQGSIATPFEQRPIGLEWSMCQRYYQIAEAGLVKYLYASPGWGVIFGGYHQFPVSMRVPPTMTANSSPNTNAGGTTVDTVGVNSFRYFATNTDLGTIVIRYVGYASSEL